MTRNELDKLAQSSTFIHRLTREDLRSIVKMIDDSDDRSIETRAVQSADIYDLATSVRSAAAILMQRADALADRVEGR